MKSLYFITIVLLLALFVHGQSIPPKCCDPMHMPVNGQCQEVKCRNDAQCAEKFQSYCTKYNTGQSICRGLSGVCGCNRERSRADKTPTGLNCPAGEKCQPDGKCGLIEQKCPDPDTVSVNNGQCTKIECRNDAECADKIQVNYCTKYKLGQAICRGLSGICGCNGERSSIDIHSANQVKPCNRKLNGNDKCVKGQICFPDGHCGPHPGCAFFGDACHPQTNKCCDGDTYCHLRNHSSSPSCVRTAFVKEPCTSGIPCETGSSCINGICSLRDDDGCDFDGAVCPPNYRCAHVPLMEGTNKKCVLNV